jgi:hypothetical protein
MKKYLLIGLVIIIGTNIFALAGVAYNRMGEVTAQLTLTERELSLPYNTGVEKENSGVSLAINWRAPSRSDTTYYSYNAQDIEITEQELIALGFKLLDKENNSWDESRELYWALEFNGALYDAELKKVELKYQTSLATYQEQPNDPNTLDRKNIRRRLDRERTTNSRLFFIEAASNYKSLAAKFSGRKDILIVKGLAKLYYNQDKKYSLLLRHLSLSNIMVPAEYTKLFSQLDSAYNNTIVQPRYAVDIKWGNRLEPWIVGVKNLAN